MKMMWKLIILRKKLCSLRKVENAWSSISSARVEVATRFCFLGTTATTSSRICETAGNGFKILFL